MEFIYFEQRNYKQVLYFNDPEFEILLCDVFFLVLHAGNIIPHANSFQFFGQTSFDTANNNIH
jgi:hypothetical protein